MDSYFLSTSRAEVTLGLGAVFSTSAPIVGCRAQMDWRTPRKDSASSVSRSRGRASGRPRIPCLARFICRWAGNDCEETEGEFDGDEDIRSSGCGSSSSAFRFRLAEPTLGNDTAMKELAWAVANDILGRTDLSGMVKSVRCGIDETREV